MKRIFVFPVLLLVLLVSFRAPLKITKGKDKPLTSTDSILQNWLSKGCVVSSLKPVKNRFYFWTTVEELDSVVSQKRLLRTSAPEEQLHYYYWNALFDSKGKRDEMRSHLQSGDRQRVRMAWPCYWSMLSETYPQSPQTQLVEVILMDSSLIVSYYPDDKKNTWEIYDLKGKRLSMTEALKRKRHIAAVFVESDAITKSQSFPMQGMYAGHIYENGSKCHYRTFVLCNENMIKSWHHAVPGVQAMMLNEISYIMLLHSFAADGNKALYNAKSKKYWLKSWYGNTRDMRTDQMYFATQRYARSCGSGLSEPVMKQILDVLRDRVKAQVKPVEKFPAADLK